MVWLILLLLFGGLGLWYFAAFLWNTIAEGRRSRKFKIIWGTRARSLNRLKEGSVPKIFVSTADVVGDVYLAEIVKQFTGQGEKVEFCGFGGSEMKAAGVNVLVETTDMASIGFLPSLRPSNLIKGLTAIGRFKKVIRGGDVNGVVLCTSPGLNQRLGWIARRWKIPTVYLFPPEVWAWGYRNPKREASRLRKIANSADKFICTFGFETRVYQELCRRYSPTSEVVPIKSHPAVDLIREATGWGEMNQAELLEYRRKHGVPENDWLVGIMPGSRVHEVRLHLDLLLEAAAIVVKHHRDRVNFVVLAPSEELTSNIRGYIERSGLVTERVRAVYGAERFVAMAACDLIVMSSGTATLEAAFLQVPMVVVYRLGKPDYLMFQRGIVELKSPGGMVAWPNILVNYYILAHNMKKLPEEWAFCPELKRAEEVNAQRIAREMLGLLESPDRLQKIKSMLKGIYTEKLKPMGTAGDIKKGILRAVYPPEPPAVLVGESR